LIAMMDVIKKTLLAGVGAAVITKEKVETALDEFVKQGKVSSNEARAMAEKIATDGRREFESMSKDLSEMLRERFAREDKKAQDRINALEARVAALERNAGLGATTTTTTTTGGATVLDASGKAAEPGV
jgi:polyhydroxyalkanoate synthesis regulator phasin